MGKGKKQKDVDWAADQYYDEKRVIVYIEHTEECPIFRVKAVELGQFLQAQFPEKIIQLIRNKNGKVPARPGAFEVSFSQNARTSIHELWSGIDKGPPRREKFPKDNEDLMPEFTKVMKKIYVAAVKMDDNLGGKDEEE